MSQPKTATGTAERVRIKPLHAEGTPHLSGTIREYDTATNDFAAHLDVQAADAEPIWFEYQESGEFYKSDDSFPGEWAIVQ